MPRESRAIPKYGGSEIELGIGSADRATAPLGPSELSWRFVSGIRQEWIPGASFSSWDSRPRLAESEDADHGYFTDETWRRKANFLLKNGARLYLDGAHPEYSTPLCPPGGKIKLAHYKAADLVLQELVERHRDNGLYVYLVKNNYGFDNVQESKPLADTTLERLLDSAVSFAHHDNYLMRRDTPWTAIVRGLLNWLPVRQIFNGQGKVGSHNRPVNHLPWCDFQISQRADFFGIPVGHDTMGPERPIVNNRDVPYADEALYQRLHVITADHNMCEVAYFLTVAPTEIRLMMIEDGFADDRFAFSDPVKAFWQISRDLTLQQPVSLSGRESRSPLDLLEEEVTRMGEYLVLYGIQNLEYHEAVAIGLETVKKLREDPEECIGELDWVTKKAFTEGRIEQGKVPSFHSHEAIQIDLNYPKIDPEQSIFFHRVIQKYHRRIISDVAIESAAHTPPPTRSALQAAVMKFFSGSVVQWNWSKITLWIPKENAEYAVDLENPLMTEAEYAPFVACRGRQEFLRLAHDAGIAKKYEKKKYAEPARPLAPVYPEDD